MHGERQRAAAKGNEDWRCFLSNVHALRVCIQMPMQNTNMQPCTISRMCLSQFHHHHRRRWDTLLPKRRIQRMLKASNEQTNARMKEANTHTHTKKNTKIYWVVNLISQFVIYWCNFRSPSSQSIFVPSIFKQYASLTYCFIILEPAQKAQMEWICLFVVGCWWFAIRIVRLFAFTVCRAASI